MGAHFAHLFLCRVGGLCCCDLFICSLSVNKHRQCTVGWLTCMVLGAKQEFFSLYFAPLFHILKNWYHTIGVHFYGEVDRGMLNVEGSRKEPPYRACRSCSDVMNFFREFLQRIIVLSMCLTDRL